MALYPTSPTSSIDRVNTGPIAIISLSEGYGSSFKQTYICFALSLVDIVLFILDKKPDRQMDKWMDNQKSSFEPRKVYAH